MKTSGLHLSALSFLLFTTSGSGLFASQPAIAYIFPAGAQRGTTVDVNVGGYYLHERAPLQVLGPGIMHSEEIVQTKTTWFEGPLIRMPASQSKENYPKDLSGTITVAEDSPLGMRRFRTWTSQGATPTRVFVIGDLPEVVEREIDGDPVPVKVDLPVTINGRIFPREEIDYWTFDAKTGHSYTCEVMATRIGSPLDSQLTVIGPDGQTVDENDDAIGSDSRIRFVAQANGLHKVRITDTSFNGLQDYVYRLTITNGPWIEQLYPFGGSKGSRTEFEIVGQSVHDGKFSFDIPTDSPAIIVHQLEENGMRSNQLYISTSDLPEIVERDDPTIRDEVRQGPIVLNGRIDQPGEIDSWKFQGVKDQQFVYDLQASIHGSRLDSVLSIHDETGKQLAESDDVSDGKTDSKLTFKFPEDGIYRVGIRDRFQARGGTEFAYRLVIDEPETSVPSFRLSFPSDTETVYRNGNKAIKVTAERLHGFNGEITLEVEGLPEGITVEENVIAADKNETALNLKADGNASIENVMVKLFGVGRQVVPKKDGEDVAESAESPEIRQRAILKATEPGDMDRDEIFLSVAMPTPFKIVGDFQTQYAAQGSTFLRHYTIERNGFEGPITITLSEKQARHLQGVTGTTITVPDKATEFDYKIKLAPWMEIGRTSRTCVMGVGIIEDKDENKHKVSFTSIQEFDQIVVLVDPGQMEVSVRPKVVTFQPGHKMKVEVDVARSKEVSGEIKVELVPPAHLKDVSAKPVILAEDQIKAVMEVEFSSEVTHPFNMPLTIRATGIPGGNLYTAEATLQVVEK